MIVRTLPKKRGPDLAMSQRTHQPEPDFMIHKLPRPQPGKIVLTHDIGIEELAKFARTGIRLSKDGDPTDAIEVYKAVNRPDLQDRPFACTTAHIAANFHARSITALYSRGANIILIIDFASVSDRLLIFNGDVGRLGKALKTGDITPSFIRALVPSELTPAVATELRYLYRNTRLRPRIEPRVHGNSFEARLFGGIRPTDILQVCMANPNDAEAKKVCARLWNLRTKIAQ